MDDHFWPALYPTIAVGLLLGLARGGIVLSVLGAIGGLAGAAALYVAFAWFGMQVSVLSFLGLLAGAAAGAYVLIGVGRRLGFGQARRAR